MSKWRRRLDRLSRNIVKVGKVVADVTLILDMIFLIAGKEVKNGDTDSATDATTDG